MPPQRLSEKVQLKKNRPEIQNCNLGQIRNVCLVNHLKVSSWKVKSCCYKNSDGKSTFNIHSTWTHDKVKGEHLKKLPKIIMLEFFTKLNTRHTFWSWLIRSVNMKWMRLVLWLRHSGHDSVHRQTGGLCETSVPHFNFVELWISIIQFMGTHNYTLKLLHFQLSPLMSLWISTIRLWISIIELLVSIIEFWICIMIGYYG